MAHRLSYDLRRTVVFGPWTDRPVHRLRVLVSPRYATGELPERSWARGLPSR